MIHLTRRHFAASALLASLAPLPAFALGSDTPSWSGTPLPEVNGAVLWTLMGRHETGWLDQAAITKNWDRLDHGTYPWRRLSMTAAPDGKAAYQHSVGEGELCFPIGLRSPIIKRQNSLDKAYLLRYRHWLGGHPGSGGKYHELEGGRGWSGNGYRTEASSTYGTDGWGCNAMRPKIKNGANAIGGLASHAEQTSLSGSTFSARTILPLGRWITVDIMALIGGDTNSGGYFILIDGAVQAKKENIKLAQVSAANCKVIQMTHRLMDGGDPDDPEDIHIRAYGEWFCDFELWRAA